MPEVKLDDTVLVCNNRSKFRAKLFNTAGTQMFFSCSADESGDISGQLQCTDVFERNWVGVRLGASLLLWGLMH